MDLALIGSSMSSLAPEDLPTISSSRRLACEWKFAKRALKGGAKTLTYKYIFVVLFYIRGFVTYSLFYYINFIY